MKNNTPEFTLSSQSSFDGLDDEQGKLPRLNPEKSNNKDVYTKTAKSLMAHKKSDAIKIDQMLSKLIT